MTRRSLVSRLSSMRGSVRTGFVFVFTGAAGFALQRTAFEALPPEVLVAGTLVAGLAVVAADRLISQSIQLSALQASRSDLATELQVAREKVAELRATGTGTEPMLGVEAIYNSHHDARADLVKTIAAAKAHVLLIGLSASSFLNDSGLERALFTFLARPFVTLEVLSLGRESAALVQRAADESQNLQFFVRQIEQSTETLGQWQRRFPNARIQLFAYDVYPYWRIQMIDDEVMFAAGYPPHGHGQDGFVMRLRPSAERGSLFGLLEHYVGTIRRGSHQVSLLAQD